MSEAPGLFEAMHTMRAMRRLKPDPVPSELIHKILDAGIRAPSGQNTQRWAFLVVTEPDGKRFFGERYDHWMRDRFGDALKDVDYATPMGRTKTTMTSWWRPSPRLRSVLHSTPS